MLSEKNTETHKRLKVNKRITAVFKHDNLLVKLISLSKVIYISPGACSAGQTSILSSIYRFTNSFTYTDFFSKLIAPDKILKRMLSPQREQITNSCWPANCLLCPPSLCPVPALTTESTPPPEQLNASHLTILLQRSSLMAVLAQWALRVYDKCRVCRERA